MLDDNNGGNGRDVQVRASTTHTGYDTVYCDYTLTVTPRHIIFRTLDSTKMYDGDTLYCDRVEVLGDGFAAGEGAIVHTQSKIKDVGTVGNYLSDDFSLLPGTNISNYSFDPHEFPFICLFCGCRRSSLLPVGFL